MLKVGSSISNKRILPEEDSLEVISSSLEKEMNESSSLNVLLHMGESNMLHGMGLTNII